MCDCVLPQKSRQYFHDVGLKRFKGPVLGYVTPWCVCVCVCVCVWCMHTCVYCV